MWRMNKFCYCCTLKTGAIIVSVGNVLILLSTIALAVMYILNNRCEMSNKTGYYILAGSLFLLVILLFIVTVLLILAMIRNKASFIIPWLVLAIVSILVYTGAVIRDVLNKDFYSLFLIVVILALLYTWIAMFSYYHQLKEGVVITPKEKALRTL